MSVKGGGHCTDFVLYNGKDHPWVKILHPGFCRPAFSISLIFSCQSIFPIISMRGNFSKNSLILPNGGHPESTIFPRKQNKIILRLYITYCVPSKCRYHWLFIPHVCGTRNVTIIYTMIPPPYKWWNEGATWSAAATQEEALMSYFQNDIFKCLCMNEKFCISIQISLNFVL